jgi:hypothetical protein
VNATQSYAKLTQRYATLTPLRRWRQFDANAKRHTLSRINLAIALIAGAGANSRTGSIARRERALTLCSSTATERGQQSAAAEDHPLAIMSAERNAAAGLAARVHAVLATSFPSAACAAAKRAIGTRNGEQDT